MPFQLGNKALLHLWVNFRSMSCRRWASGGSVELRFQAAFAAGCRIRGALTMMDGHSFRLNPAASAHALGTRVFPVRAWAFTVTRNAPEEGESRRSFPGGTYYGPRRAPRYEVYFESDGCRSDQLLSGQRGRGADLLQRRSAAEAHHVFPGHMHYHPAGSIVYARYEGDAMQLVTVASRSRSIRNGTARPDRGDGLYAPRSAGNLRSRLAEPLGQRLRQYVLDPVAAGGPAVAETMARMALYEALLTGRPARPAPTRRRRWGGRIRPRLQRAIEFIEENLHRDVSLGEIADVACKSPFHFRAHFQGRDGNHPGRLS